MRDTINFNGDRQFDKDDLDETCFSIQDTMGDITETPAGRLLSQR